MDDEEARNWARELGAKVIEFQQTTQTCIAYTAKWIRRRAKKRSLFDEKVGMAFFKGSAPGDEPWQPDRYTPTNRLEAKVEQMQAAFKKGGSAEKDYIQLGKFQQPQKQLNTQPLLKHLGTLEGRAIEDDASGLVALFKEIAALQAVGSIGYSMGDKSHSIALDASTIEPVFFDPLLGEITFPTMPAFLKWWTRCWVDRANVHPKLGNAWINIGFRTTSCDLYKSA